MRRIIALCAMPRSASAALEAIHGKTPFATDGDDLLENPAQVTQAFWETVGIPFIEDASSWEPGNGQSAYGRCEAARLTPIRQSLPIWRRKKRKHVALERTPRRVQRIHRMTMPHCRHMRQHLVRVNEAV